MEQNNQNQWSEVNKIKFHHRVKRFYYKNLFRKIYTVVIIWLIAANIFSLLKYQSFAEEWDNRNTATYSVDADGYTVTYDGKSYTVALSDLPWTYKWWNNTAWDSTSYTWSQYNDQWWWWSDTASNWYNPNPTNYDARQWPCDDGWHVPSRWEWNAIVTAWCHLNTNQCKSSDISNWYIYDSILGPEFSTSFNITQNYYWSSSPYPGNDTAASSLLVYSFYVYPYGNFREDSLNIRCIKDSTPSPSFSLTFIDKNNTSVELKSVDNIEENTTITSDMLPNVEDNHINLYYTEDGEKIDDILSVSISSDTIIYVDSIQYLSYNPDANITYTDTNGKVFEGIWTITLTDGENSITMLDRNLWATSTDIEDEDSYWYHFQWWNNYWFTRVENDSDEFAGDEELVRNDVDGEEEYADTSNNSRQNPYVSNKFILDPNWNNGWWDSPNNHDLRWWSWDDANWWWDSTVDYKRQWPCPAWYHVPSQKELNDLLVMYYTFNPNWTLNWSDYWYYVNNTTFSTNFRNAFKMPFAGCRYLENGDVYVDNNTNYWWSSSASHESYYSHYLYLDDYHVHTAYSFYRAEGLSLRCFQDAPSNNILTLKYDTDGGSAIQSQTIPDWENAYLPWYTTHKDGVNFIGWYDDEGQKVTLEMWDPSDNFEMSSSMADADGVVTVHAKWWYNVTFVDRDGAELKVEQVPEWKNATAPEVPERDGYVFDGWDVDFSNVTSDMTVTAQYKQTFTITWKDGDGNVLTTWSVAQWEMPSYAWATPTKTATSDYTYKFNGKWLPEIVAVNANAEYLAQFDATPINKWGNYSGWGGSKSSSKTSTKADTHGSAEEQISPTPLCQEGQECWDNSSLIKEGDREAVEDLKDSSADKSTSEWQNGASLIKGGAESSEAEGFSQEFVNAYNFAKANWITTKSSIKNANMNWKLTRIQMAKMLSNYAVNVLWQTPDTSKWVIKFKDVTNKMNKQYDNWVTLAYQLWIMWQNMKNNRFRPYDEVTRAEFTTALSRMIYGIKDGTWKTKYYEPHMNKLKKEWVITNTNPNMKELRGYVMLMLMRSAK